MVYLPFCLCLLGGSQCVWSVGPAELGVPGTAGAARLPAALHCRGSAGLAVVGSETRNSVDPVSVGV